MFEHQKNNDKIVKGSMVQLPVESSTNSVSLYTRFWQDCENIHRIPTFCVKICPQLLEVSLSAQQWIDRLYRHWDLFVIDNDIALKLTCNNYNYEDVKI